MDALTAASRTAPLNLDPLDDPVVTDSCPGFGGGQVSYGAADVLQPTQARQLVNIDIKDGTATTRRGTSSLGNPSGIGAQIQGLFWFFTPSYAYLVAAANTYLWQWNGSAWAKLTTGYTAASGTAQICFAQLVNKLFINDGSSHLFSWDGVTLADLGTGSSAQPPVAQFLISDGFRLWAGNLAGVPDGLACSDLLDGTTWSSAYFQIRIGSGDGDPITGICAWVNNQIVVFKRNSTYIVTADPSQTGDGIDGPGLGNATVQIVSTTIGCVSHRSIVMVGNDVWFLTDCGILSVGRVVAQQQGQVQQAISLPVQDLIDRINWSVASTAAATFWNNRYMLSLPLDSDTLPSTVLVYHTLQQGFSGTWTNWGPLCWALSKFSGLERVNFGRADGNVWQWRDWVTLLEETITDYQDAGATEIASAVTTRAMILNDAYYPKSPLNISTEHLLSTAAATLAIALDEGSPQTVAAGYSTNPNALVLPLTLPFTLPADGVARQPFSLQAFGPFRSLEAIVTTTAGKLVLRAVLATGFSDSLVID